MDGGEGEPRTAHPEGMSERDGAAGGIHVGGIDRQPKLALASNELNFVADI